MLNANASKNGETLWLKDNTVLTRYGLCRDYE
nr:MAG TPA: hypothetical protein [Bacteriophage sp.]